jgi:integrase
MPNGKRRFGRIRQLPSGRWQVRYPGPDGLDRTAPSTFARKGDADRWLASIETEIERGRWADPIAQATTVGDWGRRWLKSAQANLKIKTFAGYQLLFETRIEPIFGAQQLRAVKPMMISEWIAGMHGEGLGASRIRQAYRLLSQILRSAAENDLIAATPCRGIKLPRMPQTEPHVLSQAEAERLIAHASPPHDLLIAVLAYGGLRIGEAFALRRRSIDMQAGALVISESLAEISGHHSFDVPKTHQHRTVTLPESVLTGLGRHLDQVVGPEPDDLVFCAARDGGPIHYRGWRAGHFDPAVTAAGLCDVTPHDLRASHASWVAEAHGVMAAAQRLGHAHASVTTRHYARVTPGRDRDVAAALDAARTSQRDKQPAPQLTLEQARAIKARRSNRNAS